MGNSANREKQSGMYSSKYKGVCWDKSRNKWLANTQFNRKSIFIGYYDIEEDAALAYNKKATELFGEFACLNEITG